MSLCVGSVVRVEIDHSLKVIVVDSVKMYIYLLNVPSFFKLMSNCSIPFIILHDKHAKTYSALVNNTFLFDLLRFLYRCSTIFIFKNSLLGDLFCHHSGDRFIWVQKLCPVLYTMHCSFQILIFMEIE